MQRVVVGVVERVDGDGQHVGGVQALAVAEQPGPEHLRNGIGRTGNNRRVFRKPGVRRTTPADTGYHIQRPAESGQG